MSTQFRETLVRYLHQQQEQGIGELILSPDRMPKRTADFASKSAPAAARSTSAAAASPSKPVVPVAAVAVSNSIRTAEQKRAELEAYRRDICTCQRCPLGGTRTNFVYGEGDPGARLVFVGEAPGGEEDRLGRPFVGAAGQLLTKIIEAIKFNREQVFICNILKCRPPENRNPLPQEIEQCEPYLVRQLEIIGPAVICALGKFAAQALLKTAVPISQLRGKVHYYHDIKVVPTFHPAALLRNPAWKRMAWEDVKLVRKIHDQEAG